MEPVFSNQMLPEKTIKGSFEHGLLSPVATIADLQEACAAARLNKDAALELPALLAKEAAAQLASSGVAVAAAIGYPFGNSLIESKLAELVMAMVNGATEINLLANTQALKNGDWQYLAREINTLLPVIHAKGNGCKLVLEPVHLTENELLAAVDLYAAAGVDFIRLGTGFYPSTAILPALQLANKRTAGAVKLAIALAKSDATDWSAYWQEGAERVGWVNRATKPALTLETLN
jgi:deoxyribose-phosphate aldolase